MKVVKSPKDCCGGGKKKRAVLEYTLPHCKAA